MKTKKRPRLDYFLLGILGLIGVMIGVIGCRASLPVRVQVYNCAAAVERADGSFTLEQCRVQDDDTENVDQRGDDQVEVTPAEGEGSIQGLVQTSPRTALNRPRLGAGSGG